MMPNFLINGECSQSISSLDRGFQYGDGLFETILVESNTPCYLKEHFQRLQRGCKVLGFPAADIEIIEKEMTQLIDTNQHGVIKVLLSRGVGERGFLPPENPEITRVVSFSASELGLKKSLLCLDLILCHTQLSRQPLLAGIKHLNQLERILARRELARGAQLEGLMLDVNGVVIEGTMSNIFIVNKDVLMTPKLENTGVEGIIRNHLIYQAGKEGMDCREVELTLDDLKNAEEIFMTNSLMPVRSIKQFNIDEMVFPKTANKYANWALNCILDDIQQQVERLTVQ